MPDLADFLLARITEDEEGARAARRIVEQAIDARAAADRWTVERLSVDTRSPLPEFARADAYAEVLRFLALPYADHPDYREEWKP